MSRVDLVIPVHNEVETIEATLRDFARLNDDGDPRIRFIVCEDGSSDGTPELVRTLSDSLPIQLITSTARKGYSRAAVDGLKAATADLVAFSDSDGQYDPLDLDRMLEEVDDVDIVIGFRNPRVDPVARKLMSHAFRLVYKLMFRVPLKDPSCPLLVIRRTALERVLSPATPRLPEGFWWEFMARVFDAGLSYKELPVKHIKRPGGGTRVYHPKKLPKIAWVHLVALTGLRRELRGRVAAAQ